MKSSARAIETKKLLNLLEERFEKNSSRHPKVNWKKIETLLKTDPGKMASLARMEETGGDPDVVEIDLLKGGFAFFDCSPESPAGRRSLCFDESALEKRKVAKPLGSAENLGKKIGAQMLTEKLYLSLQEVFPFDLKTSSWVQTPLPLRNLGGALFCDRRFDRVFTYHNGAESYYAARGFRCYLEIFK